MGIRIPVDADAGSEAVMASSRKWAQATVEILIGEIGKHKATKVIDKIALDTRPLMNQSVKATIDLLREAIDDWKSHKERVEWRR